MAQQGGEGFKVVDRRRVRLGAEGASEVERQEEAPPPPEPEPTPRREPAAQASAAGGPEPAPLPSPTFPTLVQMLAVNALQALGAAPGSEEGPQAPDLPLARHCVDLLAMLEEKCRGNLSDGESRLLAQTLFDLRMLVVRAASGQRP